MGSKKGLSKILLVEGKNDQHVVWSLCSKFNIPENFDVVDCEGIDKLIEQIPVRFKQSGIETIGVIIDADTDLNAAWQKIRSVFLGQNCPVPENIPSDGLICENPGGIKTGAWIMPDNNLNGMIEDFISFLIPANDSLLPIAESTLQSIEHNHLNKYTLNHKSKAKIHTWLSWQEVPGAPLGLAITKRYLTTDNDACLKFITWLKDLYK
jgi:hypothetical protein